MNFNLFSPLLPASHLSTFLQKTGFVREFPWRSTLSFRHSLRQLWNPRGKFCLKNSPVSCCPKLKLITFIKHYTSANVMHCYPQLMQSREHLLYLVCMCLCLWVCVPELFFGWREQERLQNRLVWAFFLLKKDIGICVSVWWDINSSWQISQCSMKI